MTHKNAHTPIKLSGVRGQAEPLSPLLRQVVEEVRATSPSIDWAVLESRLFDDEGVVRHSKVASISKTRWVAYGFVAAAAAVALSLFGVRSASERNLSVNLPTLPAPASSELVVGSVLDGSTNGRVVELAGRMQIYLAPGTVARVVERSERILLALDRGAVAAAVVPVPGGEPFAVDVVGRRVAVHGTKLRVELQGETALVSVAEGIVDVGEPTGVRTVGTKVPAGYVGQFRAGFEEVRAAPGEVARVVSAALGLAIAPIVLPIGTASAEPRLAGMPDTGISKPIFARDPRVNPPTVASVSATPTPEPAATTLSVTDANAGIAKLEASLQSCAPHVADSVKLTYAGTVRLDVAPSGKISGFAFEPPLEASMRVCADKVLEAARFAAAPMPTTLRRAILIGTP